MSGRTSSGSLPKLQPITGEDTHTSRADLVYLRIIEAIRAGELHPGQRMREVELAGILNVSRTPIREAMRRLSSEGLVVLAPSRGLMVAELDEQQVQELYSLRGTLEGAAARMAAQHASAGEIEMMRRLLDGVIEAETPAEAAKANLMFHQAILNAAHNRYLNRALTQLSTSLALLPGTTFELSGRDKTATEEHEKIVAAIERRDPEGAEQAAREHIDRSGLARLRMMFETSLQADRMASRQLLGQPSD